MNFRHIIFLLIVFISAPVAQAQSFIPLEETIKMQITSRDTDICQAYSLYSFDYTGKDGDKFSADFLITKEHDTISRKSYILGQLTTMKEYILIPGGSGHKPVILHTETGVEVKTSKGINKEVYLNFDPSLPDPVFMLKQVERGIAK